MLFESSVTSGRSALLVLTRIVCYLMWRVLWPSMLTCLSPAALPPYAFYPSSAAWGPPSSSKPTTCLNPWLYFAYSNGLCEMTRVRFGGKGLDDQIFVLFCFVFNVVCVCTLGKACEEEFECFFMLNLRREKEYCFLCEQIISLCYCWTSQLLCYFMLRTNHLFENISDISLWMSVAGMMTKNIGAP